MCCNFFSIITEYYIKCIELCGCKSQQIKKQNTCYSSSNDNRQSIGIVCEHPSLRHRIYGDELV